MSDQRVLCRFAAGYCGHAVCLASYGLENRKYFAPQVVMGALVEKSVTDYQALNVYKATFEFMRKELGETEFTLPTDIEVEERIIAAAKFEEAVLLANELAETITTNRRMSHTVKAVLRDVVLLHAGVILRKDKPLG